jgi:hypothetical protein
MSAPPHISSYPVICNAIPGDFLSTPPAAPKPDIVFVTHRSVRTAISLLELPVEILVYILMHVTPLDIISLRMVRRVTSIHA